MSSGSPAAPHVTVKDDSTGRTYAFYDDTTFKEFLSQPTNAAPHPLSPYLSEFKTYPQVDQVLVTYFEEALGSCEGHQRVAGCILIGCLSELLVLRLLKAVGEFLEDLNSVQNYLNKKNNVQRQLDFTKQIVERGRTKIEGIKTLSSAQSTAFREFNGVVTHVFDSIRLRRNEYAHPTPDLNLDDLPLPSVVMSHVQAFNPYAKTLLCLIDLFKS